jgi:hypothetical protein
MRIVSGLGPDAFYVPAGDARLWTIALGPGDCPAIGAVGG